MITIFVGGEGEPKNLEEVLALILGQFPKDCPVCGNRYGLGNETQDIDGSNAWSDLPLHSLANGLETRACPCGNHLSIALMDFDAPELPEFGLPPPDEMIGEIEGGPSDREIYREEAPYGSEP